MRSRHEIGFEKKVWWINWVLEKLVWGSDGHIMWRLCYQPRPHMSHTWPLGPSSKRETYMYKLAGFYSCCRQSDLDEEVSGGWLMASQLSLSKLTNSQTVIYKQQSDIELKSIQPQALVVNHSTSGRSGQQSLKQVNNLSLLYTDLYTVILYSWVFWQLFFNLNSCNGTCFIMFAMHAMLYIQHLYDPAIVVSQSPGEP